MCVGPSTTLLWHRVKESQAFLGAGGDELHELWQLIVTLRNLWINGLAVDKLVLRFIIPIRSVGTRSLAWTWVCVSLTCSPEDSAGNMWVCLHLIGWTSSEGTWCTFPCVFSSALTIVYMPDCSCAARITSVSWPSLLPELKKEAAPCCDWNLEFLNNLKPPLVWSRSEITLGNLWDHS